jgi:hypothetical protein
MNSKSVYFGLLGLLVLPAACGQDTLDKGATPGPMGMTPAGPMMTTAPVNPAPNATATETPANPGMGEAPPAGATPPAEGTMPNLPLTPPASEPAAGGGQMPPPASETPPANMDPPEEMPPTMEPAPPARPADIVGAFDGFLFTSRCGDGGTGFDCLNSINNCSDGQNTELRRAFQVAGEAGTVFDVTVRVRGVVELKNYNNDMRAAGDDSNADSQPNFLGMGGNIPQSTYNTYELNIAPEVAGAANHYWMNARDGSNEDHESFPVDFEFTFPAQAGGSINFRMFDLNCRQIMNCGPGVGSNTCRAPRTIDLGNADPPAANFTQPFEGPANAFGQWLHFDVTKVVARE